MDDLISRREAIDLLWKALYEYEDKMERQFQESNELDVGDWILHREFVQNMSDIDRQTILAMPSAQPEIIRCKDCKWWDRKGEQSSYGYCHAIKHSYFSPHWEISIYRTYDKDFFCADAERRNDE